MEVTDQKGSQKVSLDGNVGDGFGRAVLSRLEIVTGPTGRRRWPENVKARIVAESYGAGVSVSAVARRHDLRANQLFLWRRQAREGQLVLGADVFGGDGPGHVGHDLDFVPALLAPTPPRSAIAAGGLAGPGSTGPSENLNENLIEIACNGVVVRLAGATPAQRIGEIASALQAQSGLGAGLGAGHGAGSRR